MFQKSLMLAIVAIITSGWLAKAQGCDTQYLDWQKRPAAVKAEIEKLFAYEKRNSDLPANNDGPVCMLRVNEYLLAIDIISKAKPEQSEFYFLNIGGGIKWAEGLAQFIDESDTGRAIKVYIIMVQQSGKVCESNWRETELCKIYQCQGFNVENMLSEFNARDFYLGQKIDAAFSKNIFPQLFDPLGSLVQIYDLLCPETGLLFLQGFGFLYQDDDWEEIEEDNLFNLLYAGGFQYLIHPEHAQRQFSKLVIKKRDNAPLHLPIGFDDVRLSKYSPVIIYKRLNDETNQRLNPLADTKTLYGDQDLFQQFKDNNLFDLDRACPEVKWQPVYERVII